MKKLFIAITLISLSCSSNAQSKKDSIPPTPKRYVFILDTQGFNTVDSILRLSLQTTGYELKAKDADGLRNGLSMIISYFQREKLSQDTIPAVKPKNK